MKLDPHFGSFTGGSGQLLYELRISVIEAECQAIARGADILWLKKDPSAAMARYSLRKSAQALRDAAARLDALVGNKLEAAE